LEGGILYLEEFDDGGIWKKGKTFVFDGKRETASAKRKIQKLGGGNIEPLGIIGI
jgi:predicted sulfurtransferase